jgi:hypothetical protein
MPVCSTIRHTDRERYVTRSKLGEGLLSGWLDSTPRGKVEKIK